MNTSEIQPPQTGNQCEYLGIKNDPATCLAFPSTWNYCHRAMPPASVRLAHQKRYCQSTSHVQCAVFLAEKIGPLPLDVRGRQLPTTHRPGASVLVPALLVTLVLAISLLWFLGVPTLLKGSARQLFGGVPPAAALTATPGRSPSTAVAPTTTAMPVIPFVAATISMPTAFPSTVVALDRSTPTILPAPTRVDACGHELDEKFGFGRKFIIHRVQSGESLDTYATTYGTDLATIQGINHQPLTPLLPGQIIVIPVGQRSIDEVPLFDAYQLSERTTKYAKITTLLAVHNLYEFLLYNGFVTKCPYFSGWVLAPRDKPSPQPTQICFAPDAQSAVVCYPTATPTKRSRRP